MAKITVYEDKAGEYRWDKESGGNVTADSGEGYSDRGGAVSAARKEAESGDTIVFKNSDGSEEDLGGS